MEGSNDGVLNGVTPVTIVASPAAATKRIIKSITIYNKDSNPVTISLNYVSAGGTRLICKTTLAVRDTFTLDGTYDRNGELKTSFPGGVDNGPNHAHVVEGEGEKIEESAIYLNVGSVQIDTSTVKHGFAPTLIAPAAGLLNVLGLTNGESVLTNKPMFDTTNPAAIGAVSPGTQIIAARRDHVHANTFASLAEVLAGTETAKSISPATLKGRMKRLCALISNPQLVYAQRPQVVLMRTYVAISIIEIHIACYDYSPTAEMAGDLKWADDINNGGFASAAVLHICDTTSGVFDITAHDLNVAAGKFVYYQFDASPHADIKDFYLEVDYTDD